MINVEDSVLNSDVAIDLPVIPGARKKESGGPSIAAVFDAADRYLNVIEPQVVKMNLAYYPGTLSDADASHICNLLAHHPQTLFVLPVGYSAEGSKGVDETDVTQMPWPARCAAQFSNSITTTLADSSGNLPAFADYSAKTIDVAAYGLDVPNPTPFGVTTELYGTCVATNFVLAAAVRALGDNPTLDPVLIKQRVLDSGVSVGSLANKTVSGKFIGPSVKNPARIFAGVESL